MVATAAAQDTDGASRLRACVARLPEPAAEYGIRFDGVLVLNGQAHGTCSFRAEPIQRAGRTVWRCTESTLEGTGGLTAGRVAESYADRRMSALFGKETRKGARPEESELWEWDRYKGRVLVAHTPPGGAPLTDHVFRHEGHGVASLTALFILGAAALDEAGPLETVWIEPAGATDDGRQRTSPLRFQARGKGEWRGVKAHLVEFRLRGGQLVAAYDPITGVFLGATIIDGGTIHFVDRADYERTARDDVLKHPARTPEVAAGRALLAISIADLDLLEEVLHWPTFFQRMKKRFPTMPAKDVEEFRGQIMPLLKAEVKQTFTREAFDATVRQELAHFVVKKLSPTTAIVTSPKDLSVTSFEVGEFDGVWYLLVFPGLE